MSKVALRSLLRILLILPVLLLLSLLIPQSSFADTESWQSTTSLPDQLASHVSQVYAGKLYVVGGATDHTVPENISSSVNPDGTLQPWVSSSVQSPAVFQHASAIQNNHVYMLGGSTYPPTNTVNSVYLGTIDSQNTISSWTPITTLPVNVAQAASVIVGNTIYFAGGEIEQGGAGQATGGVNQNIYAASINSDGTIGNWTQVGSLPRPLYGFGMATGGTSGNNLIIFGGEDNNGTYRTESYTAPINADGTVGTWQQTSTLPEAIYRSNVTTSGSTVYSAGGIETGGAYSNKVYFATINSDATLSPDPPARFQ